MSLHISYRATCDAPKCCASAMLPHAGTKHCRRQLAALGWASIRWRIPQSGMKYTRYGHYIEVADTGGGVRTLDLCAKHKAWRPSKGRECG